MRLPERDQLSVTREKMHSDIAVAMGGRIAEEIIFGHDKVTSGASSDIDMVTKMAKTWSQNTMIQNLERLHTVKTRKKFSR